MNNYPPAYMIGGNRGDFFERIKYPPLRQNLEDPAAKY